MLPKTLADCHQIATSNLFDEEIPRFGDLAFPIALERFRYGTAPGDDAEQTFDPNE
ncbi:MAG: hypothetical protein WD673_10135 [Alphaproteobacteria bacterium]